MNETDNHELNKYTSGEENWTHSPDMQTIEERLTVRDTEANRSNYTPHAGARFIATDTGAIYDGDGGSWNLADRKVSQVRTATIVDDDDGTTYDVGAALTGGGTVSDDPDYLWADDSILVYGSGGNLIQRVVASNQSNPIQHCIDLIGRESAGTVVFGPEQYFSPGNIVGAKGKSFIGRGGYADTEIICSQDTDLFEQSDNFDRDLRNSYFDNIRFRGNEFSDGALVNRTQGSAFAFNTTRGGTNAGAGKAPRFCLGRVSFTNWMGPDPIIDATRTSGGAFFTSTWENVNFEGWEGGLVHANNGMVGINIGTVRTNNNPANDVSDVAIKIDCPGEVRIENYVSNEHSGTEMHLLRTDAHIGTLHFETDQVLEQPNGTVGAPVVKIQNRADVTIQNPAVRGRNGAGEATAFLEVGYNSEEVDINPPTNFGQFSYSNAIVDVTDVPLGEMYLDVPRSDIAINYADGSTVNGLAGDVISRDGELADPRSGTVSATVSAGGSSTFEFVDLTDTARDVSVADFAVSVTSRGSTNSFGVSRDKVFYDESSGSWKLVLSETEGNTSVTVDAEHQPYK